MTVFKLEFESHGVLWLHRNISFSHQNESLKRLRERGPSVIFVLFYNYESIQPGEIIITSLLTATSIE